jgi:hypothetical protein
MDYSPPDICDAREIEILRSTFRDLCNQFPSLTISLTYSEGHSELHLKEESGKKHSICLKNLVQENCDSVYEIIFTIKEYLKKYDA